MHSTFKTTLLWGDYRCAPTLVFSLLGGSNKTFFSRWWMFLFNIYSMYVCVCVCDILLSYACDRWNSFQCRIIYHLHYHRCLRFLKECWKNKKIKKRCLITTVSSMRTLSSCCLRATMNLLCRKQLRHMATRDPGVILSNTCQTVTISCGEKFPLFHKQPRLNLAPLRHACT